MIDILVKDVMIPISRYVTVKKKQNHIRLDHAQGSPPKK